MDVHARHEPAPGLSVLLHALVEQANAHHPVVLDEWFGDGRTGPNLDGPGALDLGANPLHELSQREQQSILLVQEWRRPGQFNRFVFERSETLESPDPRVRSAEPP